MSNGIPRILKHLRAKGGMTQEGLAARLNVSTSLIAKFETGRLIPMPDTAQHIDEVFDSGTLVQETAAEARKTAPAEEWFRPWVDIEEHATLLRCWELDLVPGLLQTEEYARALLTDAGSVRDVEDALSGRLARQQILFREEDPVYLVAVLDESVLRREIGGPEVMREQLLALIEAGERPNVSVQVVPAGRVHPGLNGSFVVAVVDGRTVGFIDGPLDGTVVESADGTARLDRVWERIRRYALPVDQSREIIMKVAEQWT